MLPFYENERKRKINLGGSTRVSSASDLLDSVKAQREARLEQKRRQDSALRIQAFYRGRSQASATKEEVRKMFRNDVLGITGLRCLVLLGLDEAALGIWSQTVCSTAPDQVFALSKGQSWLTLVQRVALSVLTSVSRSPLSPNSLSHLQALTVLLSPGDVARAITSYLLNHDYYSLISTAFQHIPEAKSKKAPQTTSLTNLAVAPLSLYPPTSSTFVPTLSKFLVHIFTIPHLPNRIPLATLPSFVSSIPISHLHLLSPHTSQITSFLALQPNSVEARVHLVANCSMFFSPHYARFGCGIFAFWRRSAFSIPFFIGVSFSALLHYRPRRAHAQHNAVRRYYDYATTNEGRRWAESSRHGTGVEDGGARSLTAI
ncbi:hypothetical protein DFP72DRAFT_1169496 [Ephemerocybe angulata]|uniref:Uncharacterized protein n=1 Tax=Ephemerocybe angulata TaxID=980116 RepID=A0A8H6M937_9AGAR|nr:hypothetical protein DFP72DRAFT_1169496 [Tulosesus angulatus]